MTEDRIERDILIAAPVDRVWSLVAVPGFWVADPPGQSGVATTEGETMVVKHSEHGDFPLRVEKLEPPTYAAYRWISAFRDQEVREDNSTLVEFTLTSEGAETRLSVVESGFTKLAGSDELRRKNREDHADGWPQCLDALKASAEESPE
ncbi:polyketide cyclase [Streptomyces armeniacus]|uniref:Polyketide cyclase n=1 Tax=Streptomyces armeniacus TaxID=83291 RepID=A0A345XTD3_9ACTN|nr:SRPBCC domain-containing protein [Streptomyces armeniacus]AXK34899.1 polyketide cyclase [Streptomyces armeniacus]